MKRGILGVLLVSFVQSAIAEPPSWLRGTFHHIVGTRTIHYRDGQTDNFPIGGSGDTLNVHEYGGDSGQGISFSVDYGTGGGGQLFDTTGFPEMDDHGDPGHQYFQDSYNFETVTGVNQVTYHHTSVVTNNNEWDDINKRVFEIDVTFRIELLPSGEILATRTFKRFCDPSTSPFPPCKADFSGMRTETIIRASR